MSWQEQLATISSAEERELFAVLRRYADTREYTPRDVQRPCTLALRVVPSDPEFPFNLDKGLLLHVHVPVEYPHDPAVFTVECDSVPGFQAKFADAIAAHLRARQAMFPGQLVLRKTLTWLDNNLKQIIQPPRSQQATAAPPHVDEGSVGATESSGANDAMAASTAGATPSDLHVEVAPLATPVAVVTAAGKARTPRRCRFFGAGKCTQGASCLFAHTLPENSRASKKATPPSAPTSVVGATAAAPSGESAAPSTTRGKSKTKKTAPPQPMADASSNPSTTATLNSTNTLVDPGRINDSTGEAPVKSRSRRKKQKGAIQGEDAAAEQAPEAATPPAKAEKTSLSTQRNTATDKRQAKPVCRFFGRGQCHQGDACRFVHPGGDLDKLPTEEPQPTEAAETGANRTDEAASDPGDDTTTDKHMVDAPADSQKADDKPASTTPNLAESPSGGVWTASQQAQLDAALKKCPPGSFPDAKSRWHAIAECVDGRSMKECVSRFKVLSEYVKSAASTAPSATSPSFKAPTTTPKKVPRVGLAAARLLRDPTSSVAIVKASTPPPSLSPLLATKRSEPANPSNGKDDDADDDSDGTDSRIISLSTRVKLDLEVDPKAIHIQLNALFLHQIDTLQLHAWKCAFQCAQCPLSFDSVLSLSKHSIRQWCRRCSVLQTVELRPVLMHGANEVAVNLHLINCTLVDLMPPSIFLAVCSSCSEEGLVPVVPRIRSEVACRRCHVKMAVECKAFSIVNQTGDRFVDHSQPKAKKKVAKEDVMVVGQPLPNQGRCTHYAKSYRWFRFQCCGKAYPCDICHAASSCPDADKGIFASRFICGLCSREHPSQQKECPCGNVVGNTNTSTHWEGGKGCRDQARMSSADPKKFSGAAKTKSMKFKRVGAEAKKRREQRKQPSDA